MKSNQSATLTHRPRSWRKILFASFITASVAWVTWYAPTSVARAEAPALVTGLPSFTALVDAVGPSVVNIRAVEKVKARSGGAGIDPHMLEFFRRFGMPIPPGFGEAPAQESERSRPRGVGSGFVISADGYIMTNAHVIEGADELVVTLPDQREFTAKVVGSDSRTDVAIVKIEAEGLRAVQTGDANALRVGEWVIAIGSPYGLSNTVTAGIVSAKQRETGDYLPFIQTDVAINPGNSGGPLINMNGQVVGINSQIYSRSGGFQGISFAIPIDEALRVSEQLQAQGFVTRGRIGVAIDQVSKEVAQEAGLKKPAGALIRGVENGSPADKAGILPGDIILKFDGAAIEQTPDLPRIVGNTRPGTRSTVVVWRDQKEVTLRITVGEFERSDQAAAKASQGDQAEKGVIESVGLQLRALNEEERRERKLPHGLLVEAVSGAAARAGIEVGDVLLSASNRKLQQPAELAKLIDKQPKDQPIYLVYQRGDWVQYTAIRR